MRILVDIDGVLVNWLGKFREIYNEKVELHNEVYKNSPTTCNLDHMGVLIDYNVRAEINELHAGYVHDVINEIDNRDGEVYTDLAEFLVGLQDKGHEIYVCTARTKFLSETMALMINLGFKERHIICGMKDKHLLMHSFDFVIEDNPQVLQKMDHSKVLMPQWSYNWHQRGFPRVYGTRYDIMEFLTVQARGESVEIDPFKQFEGVSDPFSVSNNKPKEEC